MNRMTSAVITASLCCAIACGTQLSRTEPQTPVAPIQLNDDLTRIDLCQAIPRADIEAVIGRKLSSAPRRFEYYDTGGTSGCWYEAAKESSGEAHYGYVVLTPVSAYDTQPLYKNVPVSGIGRSAYFNNGADTRQLWIKVNEKVAMVLAFGDRENEDGAKALAKLVIAAIK